ncbi:hypothetical protein PRZ48_010984 [Zasmidium cellare]|uniref:F-box domain-containing protein n=1 Tax=Zasmidium cellare TaxID=395010 RepID=A0ABR0EAR0_ZASCE|nr:hypothetical protein PRZ48_010984 [Zasmidium cellare]
MPPKATRPLADLDYDSYYVEALRKFVRDRGGSCTDKTKRYLLTRKLKDLDRDWTFRFLDLPVELRVMIYEYLLSMDDLTGHVSTIGLLQVNKEIHGETEPILYGINTFKIRVWSRTRTYPIGYHRRRSQYNHVAETELQGRPIPQEPHQPGIGFSFNRYASLPIATLAKIRHLRLELAFFDGSPSTEQFRDINKRLFVLANAFGTSAVLKTIKFYMHPAMNPNPPEHWKLHKVLYPLAKFQCSDIEGTSPRQVKFHNFPRHTEQLLEERMAAGTPRAVNSLGPLEALNGKVKEMRKSMQKYPPIDYHLDVFLECFGRVVRGNHLHKIVGYESDKLFCRKVKACRMVFAEHEERWKKCLRDNMWEAMHRTQGGIAWENTENADGWLAIQNAFFLFLQFHTRTNTTFAMATTNTKDASKAPKSPLLRLAAELRVLIWTFALTTPTPIKYEKSTSTPPSLLLVNHQIRAEAAPIYYRENHFHISTPDLNPTGLLNFRRQSKPWLPFAIMQEKMNLRLEIVVAEENWGNVMRWAREAHGDFVLGRWASEVRSSAGVETALRVVVTAAELRGCEWGVVRGVVERMGEVSEMERVEWVKKEA